MERSEREEMLNRTIDYVMMGAPFLSFDVSLNTGQMMARMECVCEAGCHRFIIRIRVDKRGEVFIFRTGGAVDESEDDDPVRLVRPDGPPPPGLSF